MNLNTNSLAKLLLTNLNLPRTPEDERSYEETYQKSFQDEGERKIQKLVNRIRSLEREGRIDIEKVGYLSLGGADGSEVKAFLEQTHAKFGALIEISEFGTNIARRHAEKLLAQDKNFKVIQGDVISEIPTAVDFFKRCGCTCLVVSAQAILHELPHRSRAFIDWNRFFAELFHKFPTTLLFSREPCMPGSPEWQGEVEIKIEGLDDLLLQEIVKAVAGRIGYFNAPNQADMTIKCVGDGYVLSPGDLAVEALHKFLRNRELTSFRYELGEQLTSFAADEEIKVLLIKHVGNSANVDVAFLTSDGFRQAYEEKGVSARNTSGQAIQKPKTHVQIEAFQFADSQDTKRPKRPGILSVEPDAPSFLVEDDLSNLPTASADLFYNCVYQGVAAIDAKLDIERELFSKFLSEVIASIKKVGTVTTHYLNGSLGAGKSVLIDRVRWKLGSEDCRVFRVDRLTLDGLTAGRETVKFLARSKKNIVFIFDDAHDIQALGWDFLSDARSGHWPAQDRSITIVTSDNWSIRPAPTPLNRMNRSPHDHLNTVTRLSEDEIRLLVHKVVRAEREGKIKQVRCTWPETRRLEVCLADQDRNIVHILLKIKYGMSVNAALSHEISCIKDPVVLNTYRWVVLLNLLGFPLPSFLRAIAIKECDNSTPYAKLEAEIFPICEDGNWIRHGIFLRRLQNIFFDNPEERAIEFVRLIGRMDLQNSDVRDFVIAFLSDNGSLSKIKKLVVRKVQPIRDIIGAVQELWAQHSDPDLNYYGRLFVGRLYKDVLQDFESAHAHFAEAYDIKPDEGFVLRQLFWNAASASNLVEAERFARMALQQHPEDNLTQSSAAFVLSYCSYEGFMKAGEVYESLAKQNVLSAVDERRWERYKEAKEIVEAVASSDLPDAALEMMRAPRSVWKIRKKSINSYKLALKRELGGSLRRRRLNAEEASELQREADEMLKTRGDQTLKGLLLAHSARFLYEDWYFNDSEMNSEKILENFVEAENLLRRDPFVPCWKGTFFKEVFNDFAAAELAYRESLKRQGESDLEFVKNHPMPHNNMALLYANGVSEGKFEPHRLKEAHKHAQIAVNLMEKSDGDFTWPVETLADIDQLAREFGVPL